MSRQCVAGKNGSSENEFLIVSVYVLYLLKCYRLLWTASASYTFYVLLYQFLTYVLGAQWLSGRVLDSRPRGRGFELHQRHCVVVLEQDTFYPSLVLVQPRKTRPCLTERLLMDRKDSNQTKQTKICFG